VRQPDFADLLRQALERLPEQVCEIGLSH